MVKFLQRLQRPSGERPGAAWWAFIVIAAVILALLPQTLGLAQLLDLSVVLVLALLALSMSFLWGYIGILSFGQTAFFGTGGYVYAVAAMNFDSTTLPFLLGIVLPMLLAAVLGYFMVYGKLSDIYFSVMTLVITLIMNKAMRATSGSQYVVGDVRLNGQNGIPGVPPLQVPWNPEVTLFIDHVYYLAAALLILVYIGLRLLLTTPFGRVMIGIRENEQRIELLGYDARRYKLLAFILSGALAGLSGTMFAIWGNFVAPEMFGLDRAAEVIIWVIVGGKATLIGPIVGVGIIQYLTSWLGMQGVGQVTLVLGVILIVFVLAFKDGLVPTLGNLLLRLVGARPEGHIKKGSDLKKGSDV
ncbi:MAG TPA: branched-chain amino acid ABC transporter permease [Roseobacter sp.]|uniref:Branched-chain amino acid ABC transporter permease n=1 Tax=marine sediment metagenome TaxID=412755 RepID=A0A0F9V695_9ZZZZ|nr:branched-chain amino acid ABC transporter permease [Roseobacter sp.]